MFLFFGLLGWFFYMSSSLKSSSAANATSGLCASAPFPPVTPSEPVPGCMSSPLSTPQEPSASAVPVGGPSEGSERAVAAVVPSLSAPSMSATPSAQAKCTLEKMEDKVAYFDRMYT